MIKERSWVNIQLQDLLYKYENGQISQPDYLTARNKIIDGFVLEKSLDDIQRNIQENHKKRSVFSSIKSLFTS